MTTFAVSDKGMCSICWQHCRESKHAEVNSHPMYLIRYLNSNAPRMLATVDDFGALVIVKRIPADPFY